MQTFEVDGVGEYEKRRITAGVIRRKTGTKDTTPGADHDQRAKGLDEKATGDLLAGVDRSILRKTTRITAMMNLPTVRPPLVIRMSHSEVSSQFSS